MQKKKTIPSKIKVRKHLNAVNKKTGEVTYQLQMLGAAILNRKIRWVGGGPR